MSEPVRGAATAPRARSVGREVTALLAVGVLVRLAFAAIIPLFPDEAYYWEWSRRLAAGYFDHPPMVALLVRGGTALVGITSLGVRVLPVLAGLVAAAATVAIAAHLAGARAATRAAAIITVLPLAAAGLVLATPDAPLLATTALGMYAVVRAVDAAPRSAASLRWWIAAGLALGLAFCSKYTSIVLPLGVTIAVLSRRTLRARLAEPGPYVACIVATLVFLPVLWWNSHHGWISFGFQIHHGLAAPRPDPLAPFKRLGDMIGGQAGLVSPILFVMLAIAAIRALRRTSRDASFVLGVVALFAFLFFCASATRQRVEANWPAPAYIPAIPLLAAIEWRRRGTRWLGAGIALAAVLSVVIYLHAAFAILPIPPRKDPVARGAGWSDVAEAAADVARATPTAGVHYWIAGDRYQDAAELAFHAPDHPVTFALNLAGRGNQYDLWPRFPDVARRGDALIVVVDDTPDVHDAVRALRPFFDDVVRGDRLPLRAPRGDTGARRMWILHGYRGGWPASRA